MWVPPTLPIFPPFLAFHRFPTQGTNEARRVPHFSTESQNAFPVYFQNSVQFQ